MPVKPCTKDGKNGYKWGDEGKCYTGPDAKEKAANQGRAIKARKSKAANNEELVNGWMKELNDICQEKENTDG